MQSIYLTNWSKWGQQFPGQIDEKMNVPPVQKDNIKENGPKIVVICVLKFEICLFWIDRSDLCPNYSNLF